MHADPLRSPSGTQYEPLDDTAPEGCFNRMNYPAELARPRFQVILAGNAFFHIKEISTGHVRGFRGNHNEACALARSLELRS